MRPFDKPRLAVLAALVPASIALAPLPANAVDLTFSGGVSGTDPLGEAYTAGPNVFGFPTWGEAPFNNGGVDPTFNPTGLVSDGSANTFIFTYTGSQPNAFNTSFDTGFTQIGNPEGQGWDTTFLSATQVEFTAPTASEPHPAGLELEPGDQFDVIVGFEQPIDPSKFSFTVTWLDSAVPEPATWAMMLGGFGLTGAALRRRRAVLPAV